MPSSLRRRVAVAAAVTAAAAGSLSVAVPAASAATPLMRLSGDVLPGLSALTPTGDTAAGKLVTIDLTLRDPNRAAEAAYASAVTTPGSADYHHFLTPAQYGARFGVPMATYESLLEWATRDGLTFVHGTPSHDFAELQGPASAVEQTFSVHLKDFVQGGVHFYANTDAPAVPANAPVLGVIGLNSKLRSTLPAHKPAQDTCAGTVCTGLTTPQDLWSTYDQPTDNYGQGQQMAIFGEGETDQVVKDLRAFEHLHGLPQVPVRVVHADGPKASYTDTAGDEEWNIDTQSSTGMSPDVLDETLYFGADLSDQSTLNVLTTWVADPNGPLQASASYGECEENALGNALGTTPAAFSAGQMYTVSYEQELTQARAEGRTLFASTGDTGSSCPVIPAATLNGVTNEAVPVTNYPASSPQVVGVGGTVLYTDGKNATQTGLTPSGASRVEEYTWTYGGGGPSQVFAEPDYQKGVVPVASYCLINPDGSPATSGTPCRGVPDIAAQSGDVATNGYGIIAGGSPTSGGGTSLSSPMSMGMWTRIAAAAAGPLGFANNQLYKHEADFFDVGGGTSSPPAPNGAFVSTPGWDYTSGLGVMDVAKLAKDISGQTAARNDVLPSEPGSYTVDGVQQGTGTGTGTGGTGSTADAACVPLFTDAKGDDAYIGDPNGGGSNPQLDIVQGDLHNDGTTLKAILTIADLTSDTPPADSGGSEYKVSWVYKGTTYFASASVDPAGLVTYGDGTTSGRQDTQNNTDTGKVTLGKPGTVEIDVPLANVGSPTAGDTLITTGGETVAFVGTPETGGLIETVDSAGPGNDYTLGETCAATGQPGTSGGTTGVGTNLPEVPLPALLPVLGLVAAGGAYLVRRRRSA